MKSLFTSATLQLTGWYLLILMTISLVFSVAIYQISYNELDRRLQNYQQGVMAPDIFLGPLQQISEKIREAEASAAARYLIESLVYVNLVVLILGGAGSYFLARRTLQPLEKAHEAQTRFTSDVSHELRTPLAVMKSELEVALHDTSLSKEEAIEQLQSNLEETNKLISISELFLTLARLDYDKLEVTPVDIQQLARDVVTSLPKKRQQRLRHESSPPAVVKGNAAALEEVIRLLVDNALKHSPTGSSVNLSVTTKRGLVAITVTNDGHIAEEIMPHIFERFFRGDNSRTDSAHRGYGLGLSIAARIAHLHNGSITAKNKSGKVVFCVTLPASKSIKNTTKS